APLYDPNNAASGFADILNRAVSLLPVDSFRFVIKNDEISKPVVRIKVKEEGDPFFDEICVPVAYPAIDYDPFDVSGGFSDALTWLEVYSTFEKDPTDCDDTHYVGTIHWMANTSNDGGKTFTLGLGNRPDSGVGHNLIVKMEPPGSTAGK